MKKKAQGSLEFLSMFGFGLFLIVIIGGAFFIYSNSAKESFDYKQLRDLTNDLMLNIESVYFQGEGSKFTQIFTFPDGIENISLHEFNDGSGKEFDYFNITYNREEGTISEILAANENYIRFNCEVCYKRSFLPSHNVSWFNESDYSDGIKKIRLENIAGTVMVEFIKE